MCSVAESVDALQQESLFLLEVLDPAIRQGTPDAFVETDGLRRSWFSDLAAPMYDRSFHQHLKGVVQQNQGGACAPSVVRTIEQLDRQHK